MARRDGTEEGTAPVPAPAGTPEAKLPSIDAAFVERAALEAGFHRVGIARAEPLDPAPLDRMLAMGADADMRWLRATRSERLDPALVLPGAESVVALALSYLEPPEGQPDEPREGRVARYARGRDYHAVMKRKLKSFVAALRVRDAGLRAYASADSGPVMEKRWAERAGLGWVGKNACLVTTALGSFVLLATVILDRELEPDLPHPERCGSCERCLCACPTGALLEPGLLDARRCISYQTIERRGPVPDAISERLGPWIFGCDECQTACPWNQGGNECGNGRGDRRGASSERLAGQTGTQARKGGKPAPLALCDPELRARAGQRGLDLDVLLALTFEEYARRFYGTALARAKHEGLMRNALLASGLAGDARRLALVRGHLESPFEGVRAAARWAAARLGGTATPRPG